jgi:hypothetical protein
VIPIYSPRRTFDLSFSFHTSRYCSYFSPCTSLSLASDCCVAFSCSKKIFAKWTCNLLYFSYLWSHKIAKKQVISFPGYVRNLAWSHQSSVSIPVQIWVRKFHFSSIFFQLSSPSSSTNRFHQIAGGFRGEDNRWIKKLSSFFTSYQMSPNVKIITKTLKKLDLFKIIDMKIYLDTK